MTGFHRTTILLYPATLLCILQLTFPFLVANAFAPTFSKNNVPNTALRVATAKDYEATITSCKEFLCKAAESKAEDSELVLDSLLDLEKSMRKKRKAEGDSVAEEVLKNLTGDWRLIFTTGTVDTQERLKAKINYFPIKAMQSFDATTEPMTITNGIFLGDFAVLKFFGDFQFDLVKSKVEFDFDRIVVLGFSIDLPKAGAAKIGAKTGLGSKSNVKNAEKGKAAFFNWISADGNIATARGGGGGLALWKRVQLDED
eukprot:CAMPEP_0198254150 /NCGR_PEP_ID=MMETSP1447-20131203/4521_1 /TAXON_ID=420782 /ORGANISM="Chaetoceros dichaeta, Strain CCMP1751" /LENGTH=256 /DNA_ID=CAMNT_0043940113 /DNA_START=8 /DNA_END=778 /DNA_ORIENTATION=+